MPGKKRSIYIILLFSIFLAVVTDAGQSVKANENGAGKLVHIIPIENEVERGLEAFLSRATQEAVDEGADHIVFEINTPGGRVDAASEIAGMLQNLEIPTTSFIVNQALSAGSYIALNTDNIYMEPQATMGASGIITQDGNAADQKAQSAWLASMRSAAESKGRDPLYAQAMADPSIDLPEYGAPEGEYLTLDPNSAVEVEYAQGIVDDRAELLNELGLSNATIFEAETALAEDVARFLTNPVVIPILLSIASLGLIVEIFSPGFGIPGIMGIVALLLFFYGHFIAGLAGTEAIVLLIIGIALIIAEFFVPGGIVGVLGALAVVGSLLMSGYDLGHMSMSIGIAFLVAVIAAVILFRRIGMDKGVFRHIILKDQTTTEQGYVSSQNRLELIGMEGIAVTPLRPSGAGEFGDERLDVISEGSFIDKDKQIKIVKVEGVRIVVIEL
ncbi:NfeD family protein [Virgibacillus salidurans]|uniref:NfeD family protein n=1 Tax=Virgibacillus salidurans TaxID=2831673 RepID=UPI00351CD7FF